jgi:hypothetical protein
MDKRLAGALRVQGRPIGGQRTNPSRLGDWRSPDSSWEASRTGPVRKAAEKSGGDAKRSAEGAVKSASAMSFTAAAVDTAMTTTHVLQTAEEDIAYDVRGPLPTADGRPPLFMIGQPMDASGFVT